MSRLLASSSWSTGVATMLLASASLALAGNNAWTELPSPSVNGNKVIVYKLVNHPTSGSIRWAATSSGVFKSGNGGTSWSISNTGITPSPAGYYFINDMVVDPNNGSTLYITPSFQQKSTDGGTTWSRTGWNTENPQALLLAIDPLNPNTLWTAANRGIYKTTDGGVNWSYVTGTIGSSALTIDPSNPSVLYRAVSGSGIYKTSNGGISWDTVNTGLGSLHVVSVAVDPKNSSVVYAGTSGSGVFKSTNGGGSWASANVGYPKNGNAVSLNNAWVYTFLIDPSNSATVHIGTGNGIYRSDDAGAHWTEANNGPISNVVTLVLDPANANTVIGGNVNGVWGYTYASPSDADRVFNWAESLLGAYFPPGPTSQTTSGITLRYYPSTGNYLGTLNGELYVYGTVFGGLKDVGPLAVFRDAAVAAGF